MRCVINKRGRNGKPWGYWLLLGCLFSLSTAVAQQPGGGGKRITYQCENEKLSSVLRQMERLSEYYKIQFAYEDVEPYKVTVRLKDATMEKAMSELLKGTKLRYEVSGQFVQVFRLKSYSAKGTVRGVVSDTNGEPLIGVAIRNKAENKGTVTDLDGNFTLPVTTDEVTLDITYVGKKSLTYKAKNGAILRLTLEDDANIMNDVVVTGYQNIDRRHLTSAVTSVDMEDLKMPGMTNLNQMLEGKIPDMVVSTNSGALNATPRLRIRGTSTIIGNREPLWVVDGIIVNDPVNLSPDVLNDPDYVNRIGNAISGLNPQDIERLDVLKDAAATALYGTRAANGVIVITTKKGRAGKPVVSYSSQLTFRQRPRYTDDKIDVMNSKERIQFSQHLVDIHYDFPYNMPLVGYEYALQKFYSGQLSNDEFQAEVGRLQRMNTDWFDILTHDSFSQDHGVNVSGGSESVRYYASLGYTDEDDVNKESNRRYTAMAKLDITLSPKVQLSFDVNGYLNDKKYAQEGLNPVDYAYNTSRAIPAYEEDGSYAFYKKDSGSSGVLNFNILNELENSYQKQTTSSFTGTANLRYHPVEWLSLNAILSGTSTSADVEGYWGEKTFHAGSLRKSEFGVDAPLDSNMPFGGEFSKQTTRNKSYMARIQANVNKYFGKDNMHYINVALGGEANSNRYEAYEKTERGYYLDRGKKFVADIPAEYTKYTSWVLGNVPTITDTRTNLLAAYATVSYGYGDYFTVNANTRYDGSNKFGSRSNEKLLPVWSVSGMVDLKSVSGIKAKWIDAVSLKASYGEQGNMLDNQYPELVIQKGSLNGYYGELTSSTLAFANPDLKWEKTRTVNLGVEASFLQRRLMLGFEYYYKKTMDAFMNKTISDINGFSSYMVNSGVVVNRGYSFNFNAMPVKWKDFYWNVSGSLSKIMNSMNTAPGASTYDLNSFLNGTAVVKGQPIGTFWSYKFIGLSPVDGGPLFDDWEERQSELATLDKYDTYTRVLVPSGQRTPDITGSINNTFTYKSWRLNLGLYYSLGAKTRLFRVFKDFMAGYSSEMNLNRELLNAWRKPGDEAITTIPAIMGKMSDGYFFYNNHWSTNYRYTGVEIAQNAWDMYDYSDVRVVNGNYMKISNLSLTYELPKRWLDYAGLQRLAVTLGATNLYTFCSSKLKGQTPTQGGFSEIQLSDVPTYTLGFTVDF